MTGARFDAVVGSLWCQSGSHDRVPDKIRETDATAATLLLDQCEINFGEPERLYERFVRMVLLQRGLISKDDDAYLSDGYADIPGVRHFAINTFIAAH